MLFLILGNFVHLWALINFFFLELECYQLWNKIVNLFLDRCMPKFNRNLILIMQLWFDLIPLWLIFYLSGRVYCLLECWRHLHCYIIWRDLARYWLLRRYLFGRRHRQIRHNGHLWCNWVLNSWIFIDQLYPRVVVCRVLLCNWHFWQGSRCLQFPTWYECLQICWDRSWIVWTFRWWLIFQQRTVLEERFYI